jgi:hypothetical protein
LDCWKHNDFIWPFGFKSKLLTPYIFFLPCLVFVF